MSREQAQLLLRRKIAQAASASTKKVDHAVAKAVREARRLWRRGFSVRDAVRQAALLVKRSAMAGLGCPCDEKCSGSCR